MTDPAAPTTTRGGLAEPLQQSIAATVVLLLATVVGSMVISGSYVDYVQEWFRPYLIAAALAMAVLGVWTLLDITDRQARSELAHSHGLPRVGLLLVVPSLLFALATPSSLGAGALNQASPPPSENQVEFSPLPTEATTELTLADYLDRYRSGRRTDLVGRRVRMVGFVAPARDATQGDWTLNRFRIFCCVADAQLYSVAVRGAPMPVGDVVWVQLEGVIDLPASGSLPVLVASSVTVIPEPEMPYL